MATCLLCGKTGLKQIFFNQEPGGIPTDPTDMVRITDNSYGAVPGLARCRHCHLVQQHPRASEDFLPLYQDLADPLYLSEESGRRWTFRRILSKIREFQTGGNLLDVGAFAGLFIQEAKKSGFVSMGVEPSGWAVKKARELFDLSIHHGDLFSAPYSNKSFEVVTLLDVLEHVEDPRRLLKKIHSLLKPGGILVIVTPDWGSLPARILGPRWWHVRRAHLSYFTRKILVRELVEQGFDLRLARPYAWSFSLDYWSSRLDGIGLVQTSRKTLKRFFPDLFQRQIPLCFFDSMELYLTRRESES